MSEEPKKLSEPVPASPRIDRKLVVVLAADVVRFSSHMERDEESTLERLTRRRKIIDRRIEIFGGRITGTAGDSVIAEFASAVNAVDCAVKIQTDIVDANQDEENGDGLSFRIGVNVGDVMVKDADIFGDGVNVAARLETLADPDGVCISRGVHEYVRKLTNYVYEDLGEQHVKNIKHPVRAYRIVFEQGAPLVSDEDIALEQTGTQGVQADVGPPEFELSFWESIQDSENAAEFEDYLERYPDGNFVVLAKERLKALAEKEREPETPDADPVELAYWDSVKDSENTEMLRAYLESYPEGAFTDIARLQIEQLENE